MQVAQTTRAVMRLDWAEVRRSRWLHFFLILNALLAAVFIFAGMRESALLGFTGMARVMSSIAHALLLLLPLLALMLSGLVVTRGRDDGSLELLFGHPLPREKYFLGITAVRYVALIVPLAALMAFLAVTGWAVFGESVPWSALLRETAVCAALVWTFTGLALWVSVSARSQSKALIVLILIWLAAVVLVDFGLIGLMLEWGLNARAVFLLATLNPVEAARMALLSAAEPTLANLGPVGFYLVSRIGVDWLSVIGFLWPLLVGTGAWAYARREFLAGDLI
jgi:ABC-type transport system involved in multi-copper enzyme maturation permease subunit